MGTTTKGAIPSIVKKGNFATVKEECIQEQQPLKSCATQRSKEFVATRRTSYTTRWAEAFTINKTIGRDEQHWWWWGIELYGWSTQGNSLESWKQKLFYDNPNCRAA